MTRTILCFGDSNTHGTMPMPDLDGAGRFGHDQRWPSVMAKTLGPAWEVISEGHPGRTTVHDDPVEGDHRNGLRVLPALLETHRPVDLVILKLGTNDLKLRFSVNAMDIALSLERLTGVIRTMGVASDGAPPRVLLVAPPPIVEVGCLASMFEGGAAKSLHLGQCIATSAARLGVPFVDAGALIAVSSLDGIHYDGAAQVTLGLALARAVSDHFG